MKKLDFKNVEMYSISDFLTQVECNELIKLIDADNKPSEVSTSGDKYSEVSSFRTSTTANMDPANLFVQSIDDKIRAKLETSDHGETMQGQKYQVGQEFKNHTDYFEGDAYEVHCTKQNLGNRSWTFMIYLNDVEEGGSTTFHNLKESFTPKAGTAIVWKNTDIFGNVFPDTLHSGDPVIKGTKYIITKWFRNAQPAIEVKKPNEFKTWEELSKFTEKGFKVLDVPAETWGLIKEAYQILKHTIKPEFSSQKDADNAAVTKSVSDMISLDHLPTLRGLIQKQLQPIHEKWCGQELSTEFPDVDVQGNPVIGKTPVYGIRSYNSGAVLRSHVDRIRSHHISTIILVDEDSDTPWGLDIKGNDGIWENVVIKPGQMILYESATCEHGRLKPFSGKYFRNFFIHYTLKNYKYVGE